MVLYRNHAGGAAEDAAAHGSRKGVKGEDGGNAQLLLGGPVLRMEGVVHAIELDNILLAIGEKRWERLAGAEAGEGLLGLAPCNGTGKARRDVFGSDSAAVLATVCLDAADGLWVALGGVQLEEVAARGLRVYGGTAVARRRRVGGADFLEAGAVSRVGAGGARRRCARLAC